MDKLSDCAGVVAMKYWLASRRLTLDYIPDIMVDDFEAIVLEAYFSDGHHDLHQITDTVDLFAVHVMSEEETGSPFTYVNDREWMEENEDWVIADGRFDILSEVGEVLDFHKIFHAWKDIGGNSDYQYVGELFNMPIKEVW